MGTQTFLYDGAKAVSLRDLPESAWEHYTPYGPADGKVRREDLYRLVPWLFRGVNLRAQSISALPFAIYRGDTELDTTDDYANAVGFLPNPYSLLYLIEASLTIAGRAYLLREGSDRRTTDLRYLHPNSVQPQLDPVEGLVGFKRTVGQRILVLDVDQVIHFWSLDPYTEIGPSDKSPAQAALTSAGVLFGIDQFATIFFQRGAIAPTLLTITANTGADERERVKTWWQRLFSGLSNAWQTDVVNAEAVKPVKIGDGLKELENTALTAEKREDIATGLGIPQTMLFSNAANYATAKEDRLSYYRETVAPEATFIEGILNHQLFEPMGLRFQFQPESLDVFQVDENERAQAFSLYVSSGLDRSLAAEMLGLELPPGVEYADLDPDPEMVAAGQRLAAGANRPGEGEPAPLLSGNQQPPTNGNGPRAIDLAWAEAARADLDRWQRKALNRGPDAPFESAFIPDDAAALIRRRLADAEDAAAIKAVFSDISLSRGWGMDLAKAPARVIPADADQPLLPVPTVITFTERDEERAMTRWNRHMPQYRNMIGADVLNRMDYDGDDY